MPVLNELQPLDIQEAYMTFLFPFAYHNKAKGKITELIEHNGFTLFDLHKKELEDQFYGEDVRISHEELNQFFYPFLEDKLFSETTTENGLTRYSKALHLPGTFHIRQEQFAFTLLSLDITLCPFEIGIITLRVRMDETASELSNVLEFMHHFRVLQAKLEEEKGGSLTVDSTHFQSTEAFIFDKLISFIKPYLKINKKMTGYYGSLPFFEDERMFSTASLICENEVNILNEHLFRIGQLDGKTADGHEYISSSNEQYINNYVENHVHVQWAPSCYTVTSSHAQMSIMNASFYNRDKALAHFMSTNYYNILMHFFYKITLLKLSFEHSEIRWGKDRIVIENLIELITKFSSRYYFGEIVVRSEGRALSQFLRREFRIEGMFNELRATLNELYRVQADQAKDRQNQMLFMLTIYTVISGIYGMNLVIGDLKGNIDWSIIADYSFFEWITLVTTISGISIAIMITLWAGIRTIRNYFIYKNYK